MSRSRLASLAAVVVACGLSLGGCAFGEPPLPEPWQYNCTWSSEHDGSFQLGSYATATVSVTRSLLRRTVSSTELDGTGEYQGDGIWMMGNGVRLRDVSGSPAVTVVLQLEDGPRAWRLVSVGAGSDLRLVAETPNPDDSEEVVFAPSNCFDPGL